MRRFALPGPILLLPALLLPILLSGCDGFGHFLSDTHTFKSNPNLPAGNSTTMERALGQPVPRQPLQSQAGNVWPGSIPAEPTLSDLEKQMNGTNPASPATTGGMQGIAPAPSGTGASVAPTGQNAAPIFNTNQGAAVSAGGTSRFQTVPGVNGQNGGIVIPNGNGTSTLIMPNGNVQTVPTPGK
ncbi:MAG TPA: hypothetical protein VMU82_09795 [Acetobacteraceae bacterium]|nr:hypothetical protein [Acetobacteraceae bacterium]